MFLPCNLRLLLAGDPLCVVGSSGLGVGPWRPSEQGWRGRFKDDLVVEAAPGVVVRVGQAPHGEVFVVGGWGL